MSANTFHRFAPAIAVFYFACFVMAVIFGGISITIGSGVLPNAYGPLVYTLPAVWWAAIQAAMSAIGIYGAISWKPRLSALGGIMLGWIFIAFAVASIVGGATERILVSMAWPSAGIAWVCAWASIVRRGDETDG